MSRSLVQASLLATTLGLAALGSTLTPAAALPSLHPGNTRLPAPGAHAPGASMYPVGAKIHAPQVVQTAPGASIYPGKLKTPIKIGGGVDNVCPFNKFKCPPPSAGSGSGGSSPQGSGSTGPMPGGQTYPSGSAGPVVIVAPPPVYQAPQPVYQSAAPVYQAPRPVVTATSAVPVAAEPCNCLTKQYLGDGSVLFKDICTKETAMATPDQLKAQAQGAAPMVR
jgi:hypothetical protein